MSGVKNRPLRAFTMGKRHRVEADYRKSVLPVTHRREISVNGAFEIRRQVGPKHLSKPTGIGFLHWCFDKDSESRITTCG